MKTAVIICIISLSLCLNEAAEPIPRQPDPTVHTEPQVTTNADKSKNASTTESASPAPASTNKTEALTPGAQPGDKKSEDVKPAVNTPEGKNGTNTKPADNKTDGNKAETTSKPTVKPDVIPATNNATNSDGDKTVTTTPHAVTEKTTEALKPAVTEAPTLAAARGFDGPSFMGGIVLTLGLLAIGFMGFKYYKNQTERNYHTL